MHRPTNPYNDLPESSFWKLAVANKSMFDISELWSPKFNIQPHHKVSTFGSCFAQHIGNALQARGFNWLISELPPQYCDDILSKKYGYNVFSARTGNIYTTSLLKQWVKWATDMNESSEEVWLNNRRYFDPFRPNIEPNGFESELEVKQTRKTTILSFKRSIIDSDFFVFTLGLTESWLNQETKCEYPMCPGTIAGTFDNKFHKFENQKFEKIYTNLVESMELMLRVNPNLNFILTVSPVPLTATMSDRHVLISTMASKSILRAVTDQLTTEYENVDYFPSYEMINSPVFRGTFFEPNLRSVNSYGVNFVMNNFFKCLINKFGSTTASNLKSDSEIDLNDSPIDNTNAFCEEELLEAFGGN